jgi:two-component sensor histidine kinase
MQEKVTELEQRNSDISNLLSNSNSATSSISAPASRRPLARELHDGLGRELTALVMLVHGLRKQVESTDGRVSADGMARLEEYLARAQDTCRSFARGLSAEVRAPVLENSLSELAGSMEKASGIPCRFDHTGPDADLDPQPSAHLYRIAQEAVNNAVRHAEPKHIDIGLEVVEKAVILRVRNDGRGIPPDVKHGLGLRLMAHRAGMIGGTCEVLKPGAHSAGRAPGPLLRCPDQAACPGGACSVGGVPHLRDTHGQQVADLVPQERARGGAEQPAEPVVVRGADDDQVHAQVLGDVLDAAAGGTELDDPVLRRDTDALAQGIQLTARDVHQLTLQVEVRRQGRLSHEGTAGEFGLGRHVFDDVEDTESRAKALAHRQGALHHHLGLRREVHGEQEMPIGLFGHGLSLH